MKELLFPRLTKGLASVGVGGILFSIIYAGDYVAGLRRYPPEGFMAGETVVPENKLRDAVTLIQRKNTPARILLLKAFNTPDTDPDELHALALKVLSEMKHGTREERAFATEIDNLTAQTAEGKFKAEFLKNAMIPFGIPSGTSLLAGLLLCFLKQKEKIASHAKVR